MDALLISIANLGGFAAMSVVLLLLHRENIANFRTELTTERVRCDEMLEKMAVRLDRQTELLAALTAKVDGCS